MRNELKKSPVTFRIMNSTTINSKKLLKKINILNSQNSQKKIRIKKNILTNENKAKEAASNSIILKHLNYKAKDTLEPINKKISKYSNIIDDKIKTILNTSDIIDKAKDRASLLKNILQEIDDDYDNKMHKFKSLRDKSEETKDLYLNMKYKEENENTQNDKDNDKVLDKKINDNLQKNEFTKEKMHKILSDNILLMAKKREIFWYYLISNRYHTINDEKKIRFMDKLKEMLEINQIKVNKFLDEKEKKVKIENSKYFQNYKKRLKLEKKENFDKFNEKIRQENELSLRNIKDTNATLNSIKNDKSYLDEEIQLKYEHYPKNNKIKNKLINRKKFLCPNNMSKIINSNKNNIDTTDTSHSLIKKYINLMQINKQNDKIPLNNFNRSIRSNSTIMCFSKNNNNFRRKILNRLSLNRRKKPMTNNDSSYVDLEEEEKVKKRMASIYEEIKSNNILPKKDTEFINNYFKKKKFIFSKKTKQAVTIMSNSLSGINYVDVTKKLKKIHGMHVPQKYSDFFDKLDHLDKSAANIKCKIFDCLCKSKMDE